MRRGDFTVIVSREAWAAASRFKVSRRFLLSLGAGVFVLFTCFTLSTLHYYHMWKKTTHYTELKQQADQLRRENETFRLSVRQLNEKLSSLEVTAKKLEIVSGLDGEGLGGVGGPSVFVPSVLDNRGLIRHFRSLERRSISLTLNLRQLQEVYNTRTILLAATPSLMPVQGYPSGNFGYRTDPFNGKRDFHPGIDLSAPRGNKVVATADGLVVFAGQKHGYGKLVTVEHKFGVSTRYGHLGSVSTRAGQRVKKGDIIGYVGATGRATGPHLHYEVRLNGQPLNPLRFFRD